MTQDFSWKSLTGNINGQQATMISQISNKGETLKSDIYIDFNGDGINDLKIFKKGNTTSVFSAYANGGESSWVPANAKYDIYKSAVFQPSDSDKKAEEKPIDAKQEKTESKIITVKDGDTLGGIAKKHGCTVEELATLNEIKDRDKIKSGEKIEIPSKQVTTKKNTQNIENSNTLDNDELKIPKRNETLASTTQQKDTSKTEPKDVDAFFEGLGFSESSGRYNIQKGQYLGKYQMGKTALIDIGIMRKDGKFTGKYGINSKQDFLNSPDVQDQAIKDYMKIQWSYIEKSATSMIGKKINGITLTKSGLLAAAHLVGQKKVKEYISSKGSLIAKDANETSIESYLKKFANYDVSELV